MPRTFVPALRRLAPLSLLPERSGRKALWLLAAASLSLTSCSKKDALSSNTAGASAQHGQLAEPDDPGTYTPDVASATTVTKDESRAEAKPAEAEKVDSRYAVNQPQAAGPAGRMGLKEGGSSVALGGADGQFGGENDPAGKTTGNTEAYQDYGVNPMVTTAEDRLSTFAVDVDTASYAIARRKILSGELPPPASIRVEEFINYFHYEYAGPQDDAPFAVHMDAAPSPFTAKRHILRVGVQAKKLSLSERKKANLVFLVDVSGSMQSEDKLGLAKRALRILVDNLKDGDSVGLVTYAGQTRVVLEPTGLEQKARIMSAIEDLSAGGSTNMGSGIELAYDMAAKNLAPSTISRVIVLSDGDANVGNTGHEQILATITGKVKEGVTLSTIGFGMGNYKDTLMEQLANKGNGNYYYIDGLSQARRVFQEQLGGMLEVVAKDVKIQVEFNADAVARYRLIGYENRDVADRDFRDDRVDAGEIGAGHTVTALYEVELTGSSKNLATVRLRAKKPRGSEASEYTYGFAGDALQSSFEQASGDFRLACAVMAMAEIVRRSPYAASWKLDSVAKIVASVTESSDARATAERKELGQLLARLQPLASRIATR